MDLKFTINTRVNKPLSEVFDAVTNPKKIVGYFCHRADAPLVEGQTVHWSWTSKPVDHEVDVKVKQIIPNQKIVIEWPSMVGEGTTIAEMSFKTLDDGNTMISISESGWPSNENGLKASYQNCQGWQHMLTCLKAYVQHGIDMRK